MKKKDPTHGFSSLGEFLSTVRRVTDGEKQQDGRLDDLRVKTAGHMEEGVDSSGGFLVPEAWAPGIYEAAAMEGAIVRPRARVFPSTSDTLNIRTLVDSNRSSNYFGGVSFTWSLAEGGEKGDDTLTSRPAFGNVGLQAHKCVGSCFVSSELESDYGAFSEVMRQAFGAAIRFEEDDKFLWGTGAAQPIGIMNAGCLSTVARQQTSYVVYEDLTGMLKLLLPASHATAVWLINPDVLAQWLTLDTLFSNVRNVLDVNTGKLLGKPFIITEKCESLGTEGDVILADFRHYAIADRGLEVSGSRHADYSSGTAGFVTDETFWRVVLRTDGQPLLSDKITPKRGTNNLGPFVALTDMTS